VRTDVLRADVLRARRVDVVRPRLADAVRVGFAAESGDAPSMHERSKNSYGLELSASKFEALELVFVRLCITGEEKSEMHTH